METQNIKSDDYFSISELYHENSKMRMIDFSFYAWINQVNSSPQIRSVISKPNYVYKGCKSMPLEKSTQTDERKQYFIDKINQRKSIRDFDDKPIDFSSLSTILTIGNGITRKDTYADGTEWGMRTTPSPGGLFPIEILCIIQNVTGLDPGIYAYSPVGDCLYEVCKKSRTDLYNSLIEGMRPLKGSIEHSAATLLLVSNMPRVKFKYKERAYRFALLETGHIAQNLLLAAEIEDLGAVCVGGFIDDAMNEVVNIDGLEKMVQYCILVGQKTAL